MHHRGGDGWCLGEATVELRDGTVVSCTANIFLDDAEEFVCGAPAQWIVSVSPGKQVFDNNVVFILKLANLFICYS